jgi:octaheme c-type cytochrome (tetrathionate reductase family)
VTIGKKNQINNFCIGTQGNEKKCMTCHVGYGWSDANFDFNNELNVDCLACHAQSGYAKGEYGNPAANIDLLAAAKTVAAPTRKNCGKCHFDGGGGNGVKHGDLDESLIYPKEELDVHMGKLNFQCTACHTTADHSIKGRLLVDNYTIDAKDQVACTDCHNSQPHPDERLNLHTESVACQTCHIPEMALKDPTKVYWDWSTAGEDQGDDHFTYLKIKGSFLYEKNFQPTYLWFNGSNEYRYLLGDKMDPSQPTMINLPAGDINDPNAKIFPFKLHIAKQPYDSVNNILLQPLTAGEGGFWTTFDWSSALQKGSEFTGLNYSGQYGFTETYMYWPTTHMVQPKENALQCAECHSENGRLDWKALGYSGDPAEWGGRADK